ncbi:MBL fold metallo-hydrolase [Caldicoprobacter algeriensis]|uniref:MBL fold metallo-hydrolase n=1 Tax=Caldicoprobacter algeriensis TaxID=699281 RepID=UPI00207AA690|nr:MBL fold metallo-hydrolase [Caldicoprobacter algeriensis]
MKKGVSDRIIDAPQANIWYLHHSGFAVETAGHFLVFDYSCDKPESEARSLESGIVTPDQLDKDKRILVFVSHGHGDHFNKVIFDWQKDRPDIVYVLSIDIKRMVKLNWENSYVVFPYKILHIDDVMIKAYGSTDIGVSFLVEVDGLKIFHAGDLNCWYWYYESTPEELKQDKESFEREIDKMAGEPIDIAFFPVDPRLKEYYHMGGELFINRLRPDLFVPMHFWEQYDITRKFADRMKGLPTKVVSLSHRGQKIIYKKGRDA